jgi:hypothetical protein
MQPTKFSKLLKVVMPIIQGGAAGGFGGNWHQPGSGFGAAQNMFGQQRQVALQKQEMGLRQQMLQRQLYDDQFRNAQEAARTEELKSQGRRYDQLATAQNKTKPTIEDTDAGLMSVDPEKGEARPITNMAPEETGSLPLPNEPSVAPLHKAQKPVAQKAPAQQRPIAVREGEELVDSKSSRTSTPKPDEGKVESWAQSALQLAGNDPEAAVAGIQKMKTIPDNQKFAVIQRIRKLKPPAKGGRKFTRTPEEMKKLATAPPA